MPSRGELKLGTRGSQLALWQAHTVAERIVAAGGPPCHIVVIKTSGDQLRDVPLAPAGGKRLFVKEIEEALLREHVDLAVHSAKDLPAVLPDGLMIGGVLPREDPRDAVVLPAAGHREPAAANSPPTLDLLAAALGAHPVIGTGSIRRVAQLIPLFSGGRFIGIRGNIDTRLKKLDGGEHDALVLAAAGLRRLGLSSRISLALPPERCVPAPGQGVIAIELRVHDRLARQVAGLIDDPDAFAALAAERALVEGLGGGCQMPVGALASRTGGDLELIAVVAALDGTRLLRATERGTSDDPRALGTRVAQQLVAQGAEEILAAARDTLGSSEGA